MNKTLDDYLNDPDIINEPMPIREIHAIRLMIYDEVKHMTNSEFVDYFNKRHQEREYQKPIKIEPLK